MLVNSIEGTFTSSTTFTSKESFIATTIYVYSDSIVEYNLDSGQVSRKFKLNEASNHRFIDSTPDHKYLYSSDSERIYKVTVFDARSGHIDTQSWPAANFGVLLQLRISILKGMNTFLMF